MMMHEHVYNVVARVKRLLCLLFFLPLLTACDHIADDEQLIYVPQPPAKRVVLLEDYTGQRCNNCPKGTEIIDSLLASENSESLIAVAIHSGPLGKTANQKSLLSLATETGNEYFDRWMTGQGQPVGQINRHGAVGYQNWTSQVQKEMQKETFVDMLLSAGISEDQIHIHVEEMSRKGSFIGKVQVWVLEDSIVDSQVMSDGTVNRNYVHNHVFRTAANGTWGEDVIIGEGMKAEQAMTVPLDAKWNVGHLSVVAFAYNDNGVEQAVKEKVETIQ